MLVVHLPHVLFNRPWKRQKASEQPSATAELFNMASRPLSERCQAFLDVAREQSFTVGLESSEKRHKLGQFPSPKEQLNLYVGRRGLDVSETVHWRYNIQNCKQLYDVDLFPLVRDGLTDIFISGHRQHNLNIAAQTLQGTRAFFPTYEYLARERIVPIAVSYKHGVDEQLSLQRLYDGICALDYFLEPGTRYVLWIDLVPSAGIRKRKQRPDVSWLKRGLLPYQLFVVLCLDNSSSGRSRNDYVNSFWLNIEGVLATLGSGMIMVGPDLKRNAVASWLFEDRTSDIPVEYVPIVAHDQDMQVAFRPGNTMDCDEALSFLLQNAVKGAYDHTSARYNEDKEDLIRMANCVFQVEARSDFGKVAYDLDYSDYDQLFQILSSRTDPERVWLPLYRSGRTFDSAMPGEHTMYPTYISSILDPETSTDSPPWLPKHCIFFRTPTEPAGVHDIWIHFQSHDKLVAVIAMAIIKYRPTDTERNRSDGRLHVKILETKQIASNNVGTKAYGVQQVIDLWDCRLPVLIRDVLRMLDGKLLNLNGVRKFLTHSGVDCPELTSYFVSQKFESILNETLETVVDVTQDDREDMATIASDDDEDDSEGGSNDGIVRMAMSPYTIDTWLKYFSRMRAIGEAGPYSDDEQAPKGQSSPSAGATRQGSRPQEADRHENGTENTICRVRIELNPNEEAADRLPSVESGVNSSKRFFGIARPVGQVLNRVTRLLRHNISKLNCVGP